MAEIMAAHLSVVVRKAVRVRLRFGQEEQPDVFIHVARDHDDLGRLEVLLAVRHVRDAGDPPLSVDLYRRDRRPRDHLQPPCCLSARNRGHGRRVLRVHVTAAGVAEAVIHAARAVLIRLGVDPRRAGKRMPAERARRARHLVEKSGPSECRHRILAPARPFKWIATGVDAPADVASLP